MVLEGADAGQQFTVDGPEVLIGRGKPRPGETGAIFLHDPTVSGEQAAIRQTQGGAFLEHNPQATNATLVNGRAIRRHRLRAGDEIRMGRVRIEVRERSGIALSGLFQAPVATELFEAGADAATPPVPAQHPAGDTADITEFRPVPEPAPRGFVRIVGGVPGRESQRIPLRRDSTLVGRSTACHVSIGDPGISRQHCRLDWRDGALVLVHLSRTNSTCVNGTPVPDECPVQAGDEILLADQVALVLELEGARAAPRVTPDATPGSLPATRVPPATEPGPERSSRSLTDYMEEKLERDRLIEEEFSVEGSFVDVDVVGSYAMKAEAERPAHIIVSFERFRTFVEGVVNEFDGQVLNSNGDELMCFFDSTLAAVRASSAILSRLGDWNEHENLLPSPFRFRIGVHTGRSLVDRERGVAYSEVLDIAGHLQKAAPPNGLLISGATLARLPDGLPFEPAGRLPHEGIPTYRMKEPIA